MRLKRYNDISENFSEDNEGGITNKEYTEILDFITKLKDKSKNGVITDEDKILSEILNIITKERDRLDFKSYYLRRLSAIKNNHYRGRKQGVETTEFKHLVWWLQDLYEWSFVEPEGSDRVVYYWGERGENKFVLKDNLTSEGYPPEDLRTELLQKGIILSNN